MAAPSPTFSGCFASRLMATWMRTSCTAEWSTENTDFIVGKQGWQGPQTGGCPLGSAGGRLANAGEELRHESERLPRIGLEEGSDLSLHLIAEHRKIIRGCGQWQKIVDGVAEGGGESLNRIYPRRCLFFFEPANIGVTNLSLAGKLHLRHAAAKAKLTELGRKTPNNVGMLDPRLLPLCHTFPPSFVASPGGGCGNHNVDT